ncbi:exodeoxyribonuclease 7 large subunit [Bryobacterales bacterium F-183]|nr:exodeoxyribonuclease 7 large subunit [Bryobacterales bacterium F-183]
MEQLPLMMGRAGKYITVAEFTDMLRGMLEEVFPDVWLAGEISGCKQQPSGHIYFTLKDGEAVISCVAYRSAVRYLKFKPRDGVAVLARGRVDIWPPSGRYQLIVEALEPQGQGALQAAFEKLKNQLAAEGLFDSAAKRPIPPLPQRVGIITSPTGAVIQDMLRILEHRFSGLHIRLYPVAVQGEGSADQICQALEYFSESGWPDVVILARGGGSLEDLWSFNEERVARAIRASAVPVISAVGHETDYTIADFASDLRAPTPSAAADLVIQSKSRLIERVSHLEQRLHQRTQFEIANWNRRLYERGMDRAALLLRRRLGRLQQWNDEKDFQLQSRVRLVLERRHRLLDQLTTRLRALDIRIRLSEAARHKQALDARLAAAMQLRLARAKSLLSHDTVRLEQLSPLKILERGYALVLKDDGKLVKSSADVKTGDDVSIRLAKDILTAKIQGT